MDIEWPKFDINKKQCVIMRFQFINQSDNPFTVQMPYSDVMNYCNENNLNFYCSYDDDEALSASSKINN